MMLGKRHSRSVHTLIRVDTKPVEDVPGECRVFVCIRNERKRLFHFLSHHRAIGAHRFFFISHESNDGSTEFLLSQSDCHVFVTRNRFDEANQGYDWRTVLLDSYGSGHWCLNLDADELFVFPGHESASLSDFAGYLDGINAPGVFAFMLDMYAKNSISETHWPSPESSPLNAAPFFDRAYEWRLRPRSRIREAPFPRYDVIGGPRLRCFFREYLGMSKHRYNVRRVARALGARHLKMPPLLNKIPFVLWSTGVRYRTNHTTSPIRLAETTAVLLHFKFFSDFHERALTGVRHRQFFDASSEYVRYLAALRQDPELTLFDPALSVAYTDSTHLVDLGLMHDAIEWQRMRPRALAAAE
jgi:glycosyl transferase family 2